MTSAQRHKKLHWRLTRREGTALLALYGAYMVNVFIAFPPSG